MKRWILYMVCFAAFPGFKNITVDMKEVRMLYKEAVSNENACKKLIEISSVSDENRSSLLSGYKASGTMLMAKHAFNPISKMNYFKKGKQMLENAILSDSNNVELRFLRFTAQTNMPSFLGYNASIEKDKKLILSSFTKIDDAHLKSFMLPVLQQSKYLNDKEKQRLK